MFTNKKVLILCTTDNMVTQFLIPHIKHMQDNGNIVHVACNKSGPWFDQLQNEHKLKVYELPCKRNPLKLSNIKAYNILKKIVKAEGYDLIYCQQPVGGVLGRLIGKKYKIPVVYTAHGFFFYKGCKLKNKIMYKTAEKFMAKYTDVLIVINDEDYQAALKMKKNNVFKISGIGYDSSKYKEEKRTRAEMRQQLNLKDDDFVVLTIAEFIKRKNYNTMLESIAKIKGNVKFLVCGTGEDMDLIKDKIKELDIEDRVVLLGYRRDINNILNASDCFFLASHQEGLTLSIIEALNFGLPVVTSDVRGNRDLVVNNLGGFICDHLDSTGFAEKLETLRDNIDLRKSFGEFNKKQAPKYSIDNVKSELDEVYKHINFKENK